MRLVVYGAPCFPDSSLGKQHVVHTRPRKGQPNSKHHATPLTLHHASDEDEADDQSTALSPPRQQNEAHSVNGTIQSDDAQEGKKEEKKKDAAAANTGQAMTVPRKGPLEPIFTELLEHSPSTVLHVPRFEATPGQDGPPAPVHRNGNSTSGRSSSVSPGKKWRFDINRRPDNTYISLGSLQALIAQEDDVSASRLKLDEHMTRLNATLHSVRKQNAAFKEDARRLLLITDDVSLLRRYEELEHVNEILQSEGVAYELLDGLLRSKEYEKKQGEKALYTQLRNALSRSNPEQRSAPFEIIDDDDDEDDVFSPSSIYSPEYAPGRGSKWTPSSQDMERDQHRKRLVELEAEHAELLDEERMRHKFGMELDEASQFLLRTYSIRLAHLRHQTDDEPRIMAERDLAGHSPAVFYPRHRFTRHDSSVLRYAGARFPQHQFTGHDLAVLRSKSAESGLPDPCVGVIDEEGILDEVELARNPLLLPDDDISPIFSALPDGTRPQNASRTAFIDDWMLSKLRSSYVEVELLMCQLRIVAVIMSQHDILPFLLFFWSRDGGGSIYRRARERAAKSVDPSIMTDSKIYPRFPDHKSESNMLSIQPSGRPRPRSKSERSQRVRLAMLDADLRILALDSAR